MNSSIASDTNIADKFQFHPGSSDATNTTTSVVEETLTLASSKTDSDVNVVSEIVAFYFALLVYVITCGLLSITGMVTNTVNIIVFVRLGIFTESGNASLLGLSVADLCCVTSMLWLSITFAFFLLDPPGLLWEPWEMLYLTGGWPHIMFAQITRVVTAYIALERCICVVFPFKVRSILTSRRSLLAIASIFVCVGISYSPIFVFQQMVFRFDSTTNTTRLVLVSRPRWQLVTDVVYYVNGITCNISAVVIVLVCTTVTVARVNLSKVWRESLNKDTTTTTSTSTNNNTSSNPNPKPVVLTLTKTETAQNDDDPSTPPAAAATGYTNPSQTRCPASNSNEDKANTNTKDTKGSPRHTQQTVKVSTSKMDRERKLIRVITLISVIFLTCYMPDLCFMVVFSFNPEIRIMGKQKNLAVVMFSFTFLMETINSTINILIYYRMNSRYRQNIRGLFGLEKN